MRDWLKEEGVHSLEQLRMQASESSVQSETIRRTVTPEVGSIAAYLRALGFMDVWADALADTAIKFDSMH